MPGAAFLWPPLCALGGLDAKWHMADRTLHARLRATMNPHEQTKQQMSFKDTYAYCRMPSEKILAALPLRVRMLMPGVTSTSTIV